MIVIFQLVFISLKTFFTGLISRQGQKDIPCRETQPKCSYRDPSRRRRVVCNFSSPTKCNNTELVTASTEHGCDSRFMDAISTRNPSVSKEFLEQLEQQTTNKNTSDKTQSLNHNVNHLDEHGFSSPVCAFDAKPQESQEKADQECTKRSLDSCVSDRDWLNELEYLFTAGLLDELKLTLQRSFDENEDPFDFILFVVNHADHDIFSGKNSLVHLTLAQFESWLEKQNKRSKAEGVHATPTRQQQDDALEIVVTSKLLFFEPIKRIYQLDSPNNLFLEKHIRYLLDTGRRYKEAATFAYKLNLQTQFEPTEMLLPLLILDKLQLAESYVMNCVWQQRAYLSLLDDLCGMDDEELQQVVDSANIYPKPKENKIKNKILVKIGERLIKKFNLHGEDYPNVFKEKNLNGLRYLLNKKYTEKNAPPKKWDNLIETSIGFNVWLQERLIEGLVEYGDVNEAVRWSNYYNLPLDVLPLVVQQAINECNNADIQGFQLDWDDGEDSHVTQDVGSFEETPPPSQVHQLALPFDKIIFVDDEWGLAECLARITKPGTVLGFDAEWRPTMCRMESNEKLATIQLATHTEVFILDMIALLDTVDSQQLQSFGRDVFSNPNILKLGYGCESDFQVMMTSCPPFKDSLTKVQRFVDVCPLSKQILDLPQVKKKVKTVIESKQLGRFDMERGLSKLVSICMGKPLDKTYQVSDWERRPLLTQQLIYAALDAYCLLEVYSVLQQLVHESRTFVNMEPELYMSSVNGPDKKKKSRSASRSKHLKAGMEKSMSSPVNTGKPISPRHLSVVVDTMLQGLGRNLRCCGVDVHILSTGTSHKQAVEIALQENRILLTSGSPYYSLRCKVPEGMCLCIPAGTVKEQVAEIFRHFNVKVKRRDIFSRCQICNGNKYIQVSRDHVLAAYRIMKDPEMLSHVTLPHDCPINLTSLTLKETGVRLKLGLLDEEVWKRKIDLFYCCASCGKVFWEGSHFRKVLEQFAHVLDTSDSDSLQ